MVMANEFPIDNSSGLNSVKELKLNHWCIKTWHMYGPKKDFNKLLYFVITNNQIVP